VNDGVIVGVNVGVAVQNILDKGTIVVNSGGMTEQVVGVIVTSIVGTSVSLLLVAVSSSRVRGGQQGVGDRSISTVAFSEGDGPT
jgi:hypothetical protein